MGENTNGYIAFGVPTFGQLTIFLLSSFFFSLYQFPFIYPLVNVGSPAYLAGMSTCWRFWNHIRE
jgi:hypothetical protein